MKRGYIFTTLFLLILFIGNIYVKGETPIKTNIIGHWNYPNNSIQTVYVESEGSDVELFINGISFGHGKQETDSLFRFDKVIFLPGDLTAVSYDANGKELSRQTLQTAGKPAQLILKVKENPEGFFANGEDLATLQFDVTDFQGKRCGSDNRLVCLELEGPAEWIGNDSQEGGKHIRWKAVNVKNGTNSVLLKSSKTPGVIKVTAKAKGLAPVDVTLNSLPTE